MANSPYVVYTKLSPNHSGKRTHAVDRITPHCVVGQCTAEGLGDWFAKSSTQASSNYGIDRDGRVGMYVEEKNRSWCSSSNANDQRAITIECASDTTEPYAMNGKVYARLIELCVDICSRYGKKKLIWIADKNTALAYNPAADEMLLTVHLWFANKSCPGNWLYSRMGELAERVTYNLGGSAAPSQPTTPTDTGDNEKTIWNSLKARGLSDFAVAGIMGNLYAESALRPNNLQNTYEKSLGMTDDEYTAAVDNGSYGNFVKDSAGYGLAQWTFWSRKQGLLDYAKSVGKSIGDLGMQLDYLWSEIQGYKAVMSACQTATSVKEVSDVVLTVYEAPADQSDAVKTKRASYGQKYYDKYASAPAQPETPAEETGKTLYRVQVGAYSKKGNAENMLTKLKAAGFDGVIVEVEQATQTAPATATSYLVKVNTDILNVRSAPSTSSAIATTVRRNEVYTIVEESGGWGRLKSGAGWICLDYTVKV